PPSPPSPPSGPPWGTYFSRRKLRLPWPPSPASTRRLASSTNFIAFSIRYRRCAKSPRRVRLIIPDTKKPRARRGSLPFDCDERESLPGRLDRDELAIARALDGKIDYAVGAGIQ